MGLKGLMTSMGMNGFAEAGLVLSFLAFMAVLVWAMTRSRDEMEAKSRLWMEEDD